MAFSLFKKWRIVFYTTEMEHFFRAKNLLVDEGIAFRDDTLVNQQRDVQNRLAGARVYGRTNYVKNFYRLSVKEEDVGRAQAALGKLKYF